MKRIWLHTSLLALISGLFLGNAVAQAQTPSVPIHNLAGEYIGEAEQTVTGCTVFDDDGTTSGPISLSIPQEGSWRLSFEDTNEFVGTKFEGIINANGTTSGTVTLRGEGRQGDIVFTLEEEGIFQGTVIGNTLDLNDISSVWTYTEENQVTGEREVYVTNSQGFITGRLEGDRLILDFGGDDLGVETCHTEGTGEATRQSVATIAANVFPAGRAVQVGTLATAFYNIENTGVNNAVGCGIAPLTPVPGALFLYAPVDPVTSALSGPANTPVDIPAGTVQKFNITFVPNAQLAPIDVQFNVTCANATLASSTTGVNTLLLSASMTPVVDVVALTSAPDGMVILSNPTAIGAFLIASLNLGASDLVTMSVDTGSSSLPLKFLVCEFDASIGTCMLPPSPTTTRTINTGEITFYAVFVVGQGTSIPLNPATNRVFARYRDSANVVRGLTSVAVQVP